MKVIVTGMHRSGTSMVTGLLGMCGLYLGDNLLSGHRDNPKGHFENLEFLSINRDILRSNGCSWKRPPRKRIGLGAVKEERLRRFVAAWPKGRVVGWKDPRACLTLHIWKRVINRGNLKVVFCNRRWDEIAASLEGRNGLSRKRSHELAKVYMGSFLKNSKGLDWTATAYEDYFQNWETELEMLASFLGLSMPEDRKKAERFIDPALYHHRSERK